VSRLFMTNPEAMSLLNEKHTYTGHPDLGQQVDGDTWLTPRFILDPLGKFDLDPCAFAGNPGWTGATRSYTKGVGPDQDGLSLPWFGRVFMNPPFSNTAAWLRRHARHGRGISLVPATVENTVWRDTVWPKASAVLLLSGRTRFCNPDGTTTYITPLRSVALIGWDGPDREALERCGLAGVLLTDWHQTR
jgi:hypothetical protein